MNLASGTRLGAYEILAPIGAGGMGEVYRAKDTKLDREVAIKVLPPAVAQDPERLARFEREAKVLASLNSPHIAQIYGVEEAQHVRALVMELVPGGTLSQSVHGALPLPDALDYAGQIADALATAHDKGITHRDLKPANIMITPAGIVKVLDFGLAAFPSRDASGSVSGRGSDPADSPTLTLSPTRAGMILGTAAYMSPEQARGKQVDKRADIWSFGVVLYEMLTGQPLFAGETVVDILAAVIHKEPDLNRVPFQTRRLLRACLQKDSAHRLQAIGDWKLLIDSEHDPAQSSATTAAPVAPWRSRFGAATIALAGVLLVALAALAFVHFRETPPVQQSLRFQIPPPGSTQAEYLTLSPDGRMLAFVATASGPSQLWVRAMDTLESRALAGTDGAIYAFWSYDGAYLGFFADGKLKKIAVAGGPGQTLCDAASGRGGTWNRDGVVLFSAGPSSPILRVSAAGGDPSPVTKIAAAGANAGHRFPSFLPDGVHFLYTAGSEQPDTTGLFIGSLAGTPDMRILPDMTNAFYTPRAPGSTTGYLLLRREDTVMAQPFDPKSLKTLGDMFPLAERVPISVNTGFGAFSVSGNATLVYRSGRQSVSRELAWIDRAGKRLGVVGKPSEMEQVAISPDEKTVAVAIGSGNQSDIWLQDIPRNVITRFTFRSGANFSPVWSSDGGQLVYSLEAANSYGSEILRKSIAGSGQEETLLRAGLNAFPTDWSPDGKWIAYQQAGQKTAFDVWLLPTTGDRKPVVYLQTPFDEGDAVFSPEGKWIAYDSNESGQKQVYIQAIPPNGSKWQVSNSGGESPVWRRDGKELFYISADKKLTAVPIKVGATVELGTPQSLFDAAAFEQAPVGISYSPSRDGRRFLISVPAGGETAAIAPNITVVTNWQSAVKK